MKNIENKTGKLYCLISALLIIGSYAVQRAITLLVAPSRTLVLCEAIIFTVIVAVVYFLVMKSNEAFFGILTAVLGFRMLPPEISALADFSVAGEFVYYLVGRFSIVLFAMAIIRLYASQEEQRQIKPVPILLLLFAVPFVMGIADKASQFAYLHIASTMLYPYFISFTAYTAILLFTLWYANRSDSINARLITDYTIVALLVNTARRLAVILVYTLRSEHISKSYFCWVAIYVFFIASFYLLRRKKRSV